MVIMIIQWGLLILSFGGHINEGYYKNRRVLTRYSTNSYENMWFTLTQKKHPKDLR